MCVCVCVEALNYLRNKLKRFFVFNCPQNNFKQNGVVNIIKKFLHVAFPHETARITSQEKLRPFYGSEQTFIFTARPCVVDKNLIVDGNEIVIHKPMNDPIANASNGNFPPLIILYDKFFIAAMAICAGVKIFKKRVQIFLQIIFKIFQLCSPALSFAEDKPTAPNIF